MHPAALPSQLCAGHRAPPASIHPVSPAQAHHDGMTASAGLCAAATQGLMVVLGYACLAASPSRRDCGCCCKAALGSWRTGNYLDAVGWGGLLVY
jgi:hypothetical protein